MTHAAAYKYITGTNSEQTVSATPASLSSVYINGSAVAGTVTFKNGPAGDTVLTMLCSAGYTNQVMFPIPILFSKGIYATPSQGSLLTTISYV